MGYIVGQSPMPCGDIVNRIQLSKYVDTTYSQRPRAFFRKISKLERAKSLYQL